VIFTALATEERDPKTFKSEVIPLLTAKLAKNVQGYLDNIAYLYVAQADVEKPANEESNPQRRILLTASTGKYQCKNRGGRLGNYIEDPDMDTVFELAFDEGPAQPNPAIATAAVTDKPNPKPKPEV
jgi:hypothetical protein